MADEGRRQASRQDPPPVRKRVLYEDNHYIAVQKLVGELVQGDTTGDTALVDSVREFIRVRDKKPGEAFLQVVHRVDRPVGGVVLFAKTSKGLARANELFREQRIARVYWAISEEQPQELAATLTHYLVRKAAQNKSYAYTRKRPEAKLSTLSYEQVARSKNYALLEVRLHSGRHHQIRAQLAAVGCMLRGDLKYGAKRSIPGGGIGLFARSLEFDHPIRDEHVRIVAEPPADPLWDLFPR
ncbi:MAG: RNA pseudouridine synthase [Bacteroidia bacterium]|nr:MAG: RNA pseudouridine synthase [Bacteroidia bacterium]